ncbi:MAG: bis(5'-nucleosyl)-tetraphosphatase (symmetrical) YqeK [Bacillota bacterium]|jgi:predicted HD superfamily hydrolase involved in NAD metabolism|nr:bis(5'-nucleosyl)-tetraphosphatase (symmetrical) YqeK [Bacillota bacterium]
MKEKVYRRFESQVRGRLTPARFFHACAVRDCAGELAEKNGGSRAEAELAGFLHDYARDLPGAELLRLGEERGLIKNEVERFVPVLLHGPVGAELVREELGIKNTGVLKAIAHHTLGAPGMGLLEKVVYVADLTAEGRNYPGVDHLRELARKDLEEALLVGFAFSIRSCLERQKLIHPQTIAAWNFFLAQRKSLKQQVELIPG